MKKIEVELVLQEACNSDQKLLKIYLIGYLLHLSWSPVRLVARAVFLIILYLQD